MNRYAGKTDTLAALFGKPVTVTEDAVRVGEAVYPVIDEVIVLLPPERRPGAGAAGGAAFAPDIQATFGAEWRTYNEIKPEHAGEFQRYFDLVDLGALRGARVADLGCGIGRWAHYLADRCREIVLVDFSEAIFVARRHLGDRPNALFFMGDILALPFAPGSFDFVYSLGVLHHLPAPCLDVVRSLKPLAARHLYFLYYALDNRPAYFRWLLAGVTVLRKGLCRVRGERARWAITKFLLWGLYLPLIGLGRALDLVGLGRRVPLYEFYRDRSRARIEQDVYDRFFTRIEQRVTRADIETLRDTFRAVTISPDLPYWHFLCER
ncbi:MAG: class I SAM-dependent methyltransferase [Elusimicrobia bacterium]|nr:class I SAM-dependent methyltransferase [Elusimicrobiota bacterium]MBK7207235.1 class I SAM-dependent methyltransferase [Elusimicrobiota bacterium]MBK7546040.1 class I SAM-dependent methyltransferase [Elusimicrobiota bacterium]MBK7575386.1 class I SAM-dependent methyltransferase [Elusimicrobiota bacterium]MBK7687411.1 class I SAM-dependent methyltransferase [Elusimicrobiota bacterium]